MVYFEIFCRLDVLFIRKMVVCYQFLLLYIRNILTLSVRKSKKDYMIRKLHRNDASINNVVFRSRFLKK